MTQRNIRLPLAAALLAAGLTAVPVAAMAAGPSGPTMIVSTTPMAIQPSSARMTGMARRRVGRSSQRSTDF